MKNQDNIFITTTLPYANSVPHMGHAFEFVFGDVLARYYRKTIGSINTIFNIGLDEHGTKIWDAANEKGIPVKDYLLEISLIWNKFCRSFGIESDNFYHTADALHYARSSKVWEKLLVTGDIYKGKYKGLYCKGCESYKTSKDLVDGRCPDHNIDGMVSEVEEDCYKFGLSKYKQRIREYIKSDVGFLIPVDKETELLNMALEADDKPISRPVSRCPWGVPVPNDSEHVMYVWFEALLNYIFVAGYGTPAFKWDNVVQLCGPDNIYFQGVMFQGILKALDIPFTGKLLVHGTILDSAGKKMSKTVGNTVDPMQQLDKYGKDAVRYYCVAGVNNYSNSSWNESDLVNKFNADICDDWGNLVSRVLHLVGTKPYTSGNLYTPDEEYEERIDTGMKIFEKRMETFDVSTAFSFLNSMVKEANLYINDTKPWANKEESEYWPVLCNLLYAIKRINWQYSIVFPERSEVIAEGISTSKKVIAFTKIKL